jgi:alpha-methylacyl-CoA racemase
MRVLDPSAFLPGPLASPLLADMGAEVIKIEPPAGDPMRHLGPRDASGRPLFYKAINAAKSVRRMDLKQTAEREAFLRLVVDCDVLIEGFRPGVMKRLGLGYAALHEINRRLIYYSLSGFGASGPMSHRAGHDVNYLATSGMLHHNGSDAPLFYDPPLSDLSSSLFGVIAIPGALRAREVDGQGCLIDLGLADVAMPLQLFQVAAHGAIGEVPQRRQTYLNGGAAYYQVYATADGRHMALGAAEPKFWRAFCEAAGRPDWIGREAEALPQTGLTAEVAALMGSLTWTECTARFAAPDCCVSPVFDLGEAVGSPQRHARGLVRRSPDGALQALFPARIDGEAPAHRPTLRHIEGEEETASTWRT